MNDTAKWHVFGVFNHQTKRWGYAAVHPDTYAQQFDSAEEAWTYVQFRIASFRLAKTRPAIKSLLSKLSGK